MAERYRSKRPGERARDEALELVARNNPNFMRNAEIAARKYFRPGTELIFEDIRVKLTEVGIKPRHHNAWGALSNVLVRNGFLIPTGTRQNMREKTSHARSSAVYVIAGNATETAPNGFIRRRFAS